LQYAGDGKEHSLRDAITFLADVFNLSDEERKELLSSGQQAVFDNRVGWARTHLKKAGLLESPKRGFFQITNRGKEILKQNNPEINVKFLNQFPEFIEFKTIKKDNDKSESEITEDSEILETTPQESIEFGYQKIRKELELELLNRVKSCSPDFFERLVVDLLVKMGYGGSRRDAGRAIGKAGDGGIDGIIKEDKLG
ncbi:MAG: winged helix-turn-helix domain-containing protein, partial [Sphaerospermopsis kisseleviana]